MSEWSVKRFWTEVSVNEGDSGFQVLLDDRPIRTPAKRALIAPTRRIADRIAAEWSAQDPLGQRCHRQGGNAARRS